MKKAVIGALGASALLLSATTSAQQFDPEQVEASVGYMHLSNGISLGALYGTVGYRFEIQQDLYVIPELRIGLGINDDTYRFAGSQTSIELDSVFGFNGRVQYDVNPELYIYGTPSFTRLETSVSSSAQGFGGGSYSYSDWEFGIGAGAGYQFSDQLSGEVQYESIDSLDVFSFGLRYNF